MRYFNRRFLDSKANILGWQKMAIDSASYVAKSRHKSATTIALLALLLSACSSINIADESTSTADQQAELKAIAKALVAETELDNASVVLANKSLSDEAAPQVQFQATKQSVEYQRKLAQVKLSTPEHIITLYQRALVAMKAQQWQQAEQLFAQVITHNPELSGSYLNQAIIAQKQQQLGLAQEKINQALKVNPINPYAHNLNGVLARQSGDFNLAEKSYLMALNSLPDYGDAHLNLAILAELYQGKLALAKQHYQLYLLIHQEDKQVQGWLAGLSLKLAQTGEGE